jgi:membrane protease YdiL (CAAX protease family)
MNKEFSPPPNFPLAAAMFEGGLALVAIALGWWFAEPPLGSFQGTPQAFALGAAGTLPLLGLLALCLWRPVGPLAPILHAIDDLLIPLFEHCRLVELAVICLLAGLGEEMLFRGVLQAGIADWAARWLGGPPQRHLADGLALAVTAVAFGLLHAVNAAYAVIAGLIGLYLGWLWLATGDLAVPITTHALYDFLALVYLVKVRRPRPTQGAS